MAAASAPIDSTSHGRAGQFLGLKRLIESCQSDRRLRSDNWAWTSTTSGANVVRGPAPVGGAVAIGPDGEELRSWT